MCAKEVRALARKRKKAAIERNERPSLFEFSTLGIDAYGLRAGTNKRATQHPEYDLRGNVVALDVPRASYVISAPRLGYVARLSDRAALSVSDDEYEPDDRHLRAPLHLGGRPKKMGPATRAKYEYWDTMTNVYEEPLLPVPSSELRRQVLEECC